MDPAQSKAGVSYNIITFVNEFCFVRPVIATSHPNMILLGVFGLLSLACLRIVGTWQTWGDLSIDIGHETYVPAMLAAGKVLYRDLWYHYGPAAPYFNCALFKIFGVRLGVLCFAGSVAAILAGIFLFLSGIELGFPMVGWTAGAVVITEAFEPGYFSFPLPYSFAAVYGCLAACSLMLVSLRALRGRTSLWVLLGGGIAAFALLLKLEFGLALYLTLGLTILLRTMNSRSLATLAWDVTATLPGLVICASVIHWMASIHGIEFITHENIASWPTSYFMKTFGSAWLRGTGFTLTASALGRATLQTIFLAGVFWAIRECTSGAKLTIGRVLIRLNIALWLFALYRIFLEQLSPLYLLNAAFLPEPMVLYVVLGTALAWWLFSSRSLGEVPAGLCVVLSLASLVSFRGLLKMEPWGYAIYFAGPVVLGYLILAGVIVECGRPTGRATGSARNFLCYLSLGTVAFWALALDLHNRPLVPLKTDFGTVRVKDDVAKNYEAGIRFLKENNTGRDRVLILPEDTTMYFLSGTRAPTRVYLFTPGIVAPGHMTEELFNEIETSHIEFLLWSNRLFPEYGAPVFGKDFNQELAEFLRQRYELVGPLVDGIEGDDKLQFTVWKRRPNGTNSETAE